MMTLPSETSVSASRETASDRPGVAQPVPARPVPTQPWHRISLAALILFALLTGGWEMYWRAFGVAPSIRNTDALWAIQRRRIDAGEGASTVLLGSSRVYFDIRLAVWEKLDGKRPLQLAFEGTSPVAFMQDLAADPNFTGRLLVGMAPDIFFGTHTRHNSALGYYRKESPAQHAGQWLSMHFIEPYFAFYDPDFALASVLKRQPWPPRPGKRWFSDVRKMSTSEADRDTQLWSKVETDPTYREIARATWMQQFVPGPDDPSPADIDLDIRKKIEATAAAVKQLRARGVQVLFVRAPSAGPYLEFENRVYPRAKTWDALLAATGAPGIHFEDYPELQGFELPEWSHVAPSQTERFTEALYTIIARDFWKKKISPQ
jgi:hypothetical protein